MEYFQSLPVLKIGCLRSRRFATGWFCVYSSGSAQSPHTGCRKCNSQRQLQSRGTDKTIKARIQFSLSRVSGGNRPRHLYPPPFIPPTSSGQHKKKGDHSRDTQWMSELSVAEKKINGSDKTRRRRMETAFIIKIKYGGTCISQMRPGLFGSGSSRHMHSSTQYTVCDTESGDTRHSRT